MTFRIDIVAVTIQHELPVSLDKEGSSQQIATLDAGTKVCIVEFVKKLDEQCLRARIESPAGWITMWRDDGSRDGIACAEILGSMPATWMYSDSGGINEGASAPPTTPALEQDELKKQDLVVHGVNGILTRLNTHGISSILELKTRIQIFTGIPVAEQRLFGDGAILFLSDPVPKREVFVLRVALSRSRCNRKAHVGLHSPLPKELEPGTTAFPPEEPATLVCKADCYREERKVSSLGYRRKGDRSKARDERNTVANLQSGGFKGFTHIPTSIHESVCINL